MGFNEDLKQLSEKNALLHGEYCTKKLLPATYNTFLRGRDNVS